LLFTGTTNWAKLKLGRLGLVIGTGPFGRETR
jgi:hypothetical protein